MLLYLLYGCSSILFAYLQKVWYNRDKINQ